MDIISTQERWRSNLPHWEVDGHWHFVTIRCHGSLPEQAKCKLLEIYRSLEAIDPQSEEFLQLQGRYFLTAEKYLDAGLGFAPFTASRTCEPCLEAFAEMQAEGWNVGEVSIMPNHVHLLILRQQSDCSLRQLVRRFKGRSSRWINQAMGRTGRFWQEDWFDRWMRDDTERAKTSTYIRNNPVKAGLVKEWTEYQWRISTEFEP
jgi:REP element-mobilizing transposase RayT